MRWVISLLALANFSVYLWGTLRPYNDHSIEFAPLEVGVIRLIEEPAADGVIPKGLESPASITESEEFLSTLVFDDAGRSSTNSGQACGELVWFKETACLWCNLVVVNCCKWHHCSRLLWCCCN